MSKKGLIFILFIWACAVGAYSQNNTSSPYTRYGYGSLVDAGFGYNKSLGGISYGMRNHKYINPANPASFTAIDSLTFRFEAGASLKVSSFSDAGGDQSKLNGNFEYLAFQFPIKQWLGVSLGLIPYSFVGYDFMDKQTISFPLTGEEAEVTNTYNGSGGITQVYLGVGVNPFKNFSVGASLGFNFGKIEHASTVSFSNTLYYSTYHTKTISVTDFSGLFGAQYAIQLPKEQQITLGATFQLKSKLSADAEQTIITTDTLELNDNNSFDTPLTFGAGFVYNLSDRFLAGFDYKYQAWSDVRYFGEKPFTDRNKYSVGFEFQPDNSSKNYLKRIYYRVGANYSNSYFKVHDEKLNEYTVSAGFGLPLRRTPNPTLLNLVFEYGNMGVKNDNLIKEQYFKFTLSATINERWFMKRKFD